MGFNFADARLTGGAWQREARPALLREFFRVLAVCHTVMPDGMRSASHIQCHSACAFCISSLHWLSAVGFDIARCSSCLRTEVPIILMTHFCASVCPAAQ